MLCAHEWMETDSWLAQSGRRPTLCDWPWPCCQCVCFVIEKVHLLLCVLLSSNAWRPSSEEDAMLVIYWLARYLRWLATNSNLAHKAKMCWPSLVAIIEIAFGHFTLLSSLFLFSLGAISWCSASFSAIVALNLICPIIYISIALDALGHGRLFEDVPTVSVVGTASSVYSLCQFWC